MLHFVAVMLSAALVLGACGDKEVVENPPTTEEVENEFGFRSFDLDVDTADKKDAIEASFDLDMSETEAEYNNKLTGTKLSGKKAYNELQPIFKALGLTSAKTREEVIEQVAEAFDVADYKEFDLEIDFMDEIEQDYSDMK